jgi:N6-adenosine-specific RNA methylase IME4
MTHEKTNRPTGDRAAREGFSSSGDEFTHHSQGTEAAQATPLIRYDAACAALAEARSVDEVKDIRDQAIAMAAYARQAKNRDLEANAVEIRMRATRRLDQLRQAQKETVGLNQGAAGGGEKAGPRGLLVNPRDLRPTLSSQGIDKNLAHQARVLGALSDDKFEAVVADARDKVARAVRNAVREVEILQERETYGARTSQGGNVADLNALAASGYGASVIYVDVPSRYTTYSGKGKQRSADRYYDTMDVAELLKALEPSLIQKLAAKNCALLYWTSGPQNANALEVIKAWGFDFRTWAFVWVKTNPSSGIPELEDLQFEQLHWGTGFTTRANAEVVLLAGRGSPRRLAEDVHQIVIAPAMAHSEKPEESPVALSDSIPVHTSSCLPASCATAGRRGATRSRRRRIRSTSPPACGGCPPRALAGSQIQRKPYARGQRSPLHRDVLALRRWADRRGIRSES